MNSVENPTAFVPSASEYILDNFEQTDRIAMLVLNRDFGETIQRITSAQKAASPEFQAWLRYKNANGSDIYIGTKPAPEGRLNANQGRHRIHPACLSRPGSRRAGSPGIRRKLQRRPETKLRPDQFARKIPGCLEGGRHESRRGRRTSARHGTRIRWRSRRHRCDPRLAPAGFRQQEIRNGLLCRGSQGVHGNLPPSRFQTAHRLPRFTTPQLRHPRKAGILASHQSRASPNTTGLSPNAH